MISDCPSCVGLQRVGEYLLPDGRRVAVRYKCHRCGQGEQDSVADVAPELMPKESDRD